MSWILVGAGGAIGSVLRHGLNQWSHARWPGTFPLGIFAINVIGSVAIGVLAGLAASGRWSVSVETRTFFMAGVLGGFTTFSSFSLDTLTLLRGGQYAYAIANVLGQVVLSLIGVAAGFQLGLLPRR
jgi:CrcB protein